MTDPISNFAGLPPGETSRLVALLEELQSSVQSLLELRFPQTEAVPENRWLLAGDEKSELADIFNFDSSMPEEERELLVQRCGTVDIGLLILEASRSLEGLAAFMKTVDPQVKNSSSVIYSLGCLLERAVKLVGDILAAFIMFSPGNNLQEQ